MGAAAQVHVPDRRRVCALLSTLIVSCAFASAGCVEESASGGASGRCDPNYKGACLDPNASDYDCAGGSGDGPKYVQGPVTVVGDDHYGLDRDGDGVACES
jgi:hypothetical protein